MIKVSVPFIAQNNLATGVGIFYINNGFIIKQEIELISARVTTRIGNGEVKETNGYKSHSKRCSLRDELLGQNEFIPKSEKKNSKVVEINLTNEQLRTTEGIVNSNTKGTMLSTLIGILTYVNPTGSNKIVTQSPLKISSGIYKGYRFYNLFNNEFARTTKQVATIDGVHMDEMTIEEWVNNFETNKLQFALYNYEREESFLLEKGFDFRSIKNPTYDKLLGHAIEHVNKNSKKYLISLLRSKYKKEVMNSPKYKFDFVYQDTLKENTEAAHIYEVHMIKKLEEKYDAIADVDNCLLLTPSVHRAWDREQIKILPNGEIKNISMEEERFERMFKSVKYSLSYKLDQKQQEYIKRRNDVLRI